MQKITKIVITGGPCAGKTTAMSWVRNAFTKKGYTVLFVPETATELISGGVAPWTCGTNEEYQVGQMRLQAMKERVFEDAARTMPGENILIVCDRGQLDNRAYMSHEEFDSVLSRLGMDEVRLRDGYDAVFHLVTAARGAEEFYSNASNAIRYENVEQAVALDDRIAAAWTGHPHLRIIDNSMSFEDKMKKLVAEIAAFLGEPMPYELERKYLIEYPDIAMLEADPACRKVEILQTYLRSAPGEEVRIRQRGENGNYIFYKTTKRRVTGLKRVELEERLSEGKYLEMMMEADPEKRPIRKTRYCMTYEGQYFEIDVFPFWSDKAIVEIELHSETQEVCLPPTLKVIREVTDDEAYTNVSLAMRK